MVKNCLNEPLSDLSNPSGSGLTKTPDLTYYTTTYGFNTTYNTSPDYVQQIPATASADVRGMGTWTQTKIIGTTSNVYTVNLYDVKGQLVQVKSKNSTGGFDLAYSQYNWAGQPITTVLKNEKAGVPAQTSVIVS